MIAKIIGTLLALFTIGVVLCWTCGCVQPGGVVVFDEDAARAFGDEIGQSSEAIGEMVIDKLDEKLPSSPAGATDVYGAVAAAAVAYGMNKWRLGAAAKKAANGKP